MQATSDVAAAAAAPAPLDLHEGICTPGGCGRWPKPLRLRASDGSLVLGRCGSTNLCLYCARLSAVENAEVLALDAMASGGPAVWAVLTTRTAERDPAPFYRARAKVMKALKRRWPDVQYAAQVEFTTGYSARSQGRRRPHWNLLLKGIPAADVHEAREVAVRVWCARVDAVPAGQYVDLVEHVGGLMRYLALHFAKPAQAPPHGWRGHRFLHSRGYFEGGIAAARVQARDALQTRREVWKYEQMAEQAGVELWPVEIYELAEARRAHQRGLSWEMVSVVQLGDGRVTPSSDVAAMAAATRPRRAVR